MELSPINKTSQIQVLMVTDVHLGEMREQRGQLLLNLIKAATEWQVETFVLGGDIFDFCQGSHPFFQSKYSSLGKALEGLARSGTKVLFVEGNHEFDIQDLKWLGVEFITETQRIFTTQSGAAILLSHGDRLYNSRSYRIFRNIVKSTLVRWTARYLVPARFLEWYTTRHSQVSRAADRYRSLDHVSLLKQMNHVVTSSGARHLLFGHFHIPYCQQRQDGVDGKIASCESWERPNALIMMGDQFSRLFWDRHTSEWVRQPALELDFEH